MTIEGVTIASDSADAEAAGAVLRHHTAMVDEARALTDAVIDAVDTDGDVIAARTAASAYFRDEVLPHALAEEETLYRAAARQDRARLLIEAMEGEHRVIGDLIDRLATANAPGEAAAAAGALSEIFEAHVVKENEIVLPLLASAPDISLAALVGGLHELVGASEPAAATGGCGCGCKCGAS